MRIVGGRLKGRKLTAPASRLTRPTADRVREAVFNVLAHGIESPPMEGAQVLDLFAGSGALGFEALSHGAERCLFIDDNEHARASIRHNADALGVLGQCKIWRRDATRLGRCAPMPPFELVFADPPYGRGLAEMALAALAHGGWCKRGAVVVIEEQRGVDIAIPAALHLAAQRAYGASQILFFISEAPSF